MVSSWGYKKSGLAFLAEKSVRMDIIDPEFSGPESNWFHLDDKVPLDSEIRVRHADGSAFRLHPASSTEAKS